MKNALCNLLGVVLFSIGFTPFLLSNNTIQFNTSAQQFGVADLDFFEVTMDTAVSGSVYEAEFPGAATVGLPIFRGNASNDLVWGQFGSSEGGVWYNNVAGSGEVFIRIRYSRRHFMEAPPVEIYVNNEWQASWIPEDTDDWNNFQFTDWIPIKLRTVLGAGYCHSLQNYNDDVDRIKKFSNAFTGNAGIVGDISVLQLNYTKAGTRMGSGRHLDISYDIKENFAGYLESFKWDWFDNNSAFDLTNLFPEFLGEGFENRRIDSIAFFFKLVADAPLTMKLELSDVDGHKGEHILALESHDEWQRIAVAIGDFNSPSGTPPFNPAKAKFLGFIFAQTVGGVQVNQNKSGIFSLDDIYLIESNFEKPQFQNDQELLAYLNKVRFKFFWEAVAPSSYLIFDRHLWDDLISVDGIGWQLSAYTIAHRNAWVDPEAIEDRTEQILFNLLYRCQHTTEIDSAKAYPLRYASVNGNWAHFLDSGTLKRKNLQTEYSLFTNALLLSGIVVARQYFAENESIVAKADSLIAMTDWNFLYDEETNLMHFHWTPGEGLSRFKTDWFSEELDLAFLLGISTPVPEHRLPNNPYFANGYRRPLCEEETGDYVFSAPGTGFTYWFLQMYARFSENSQRYENARHALLKDFSIDQNQFGDFILSYDERIGGVSACEGPDSSGFIVVGLDTINISNYHAYGYCCKLDTNNDPNGTMAIYGGLSTILFTPAEAIELNKYYYYTLDSLFQDEYGYHFWSPIFGFPDAFHLDPDNAYDTSINGLDFNGPWLSVPRFAIDVGPMLINTDSYLVEAGALSGNSIRDLFSTYPPIAQHLPTFDTIVVLDMPESVQVQLGSEAGAAGEVEVYATIANQEHFDYEYRWWFNDSILVDRTSDSTLTIDADLLSSSDQISCNLLLPLSSCDDFLFTTSNSLMNLVNAGEQPYRLLRFEIYPNPTTDLLNIIVELPFGANGAVSVQNAFGQLLHQEEFLESLYRETFDLSNLSAGLYFVSLEIDGVRRSKRVFKH
ncbi:MAG: T9SS type A sorting domain-containing protein [Saprospiraceae bacterium]|nr:T9SS type A sorting domain-containing protein [Saprospiraceae bacterium]